MDLIHARDTNDSSIIFLMKLHKDTFSTEQLFSQILQYLQKDLDEISDQIKSFYAPNSLILIQNRALNAALFRYLDLRESPDEFPDEAPENYDQIFFRTLYYLKEINIIQILPTITGDSSIYLRMYTFNNYEIHLEVFADYDETVEEDVEAISSLYNNKDELILNYSGTLEKVIQKLKEFLNNPGSHQVSSLDDLDRISGQHTSKPSSTTTTV